MNERRRESNENASVAIATISWSSIEADYYDERGALFTWNSNIRPIALVVSFI